MKRIIALTLLAASMAVAGPLKALYMATYPARHPMKTAHVTGKVLKTVLW